MRIVLNLLMIAAVGCAGTDGTNGTNGVNGADGTDGSDGADGSNGGESLIRLDDEPAGAHCTNGGTAIHTGIDDDDDGVLEDSEIDNTAYVCNASDGRPSGTVQGTFTIHNSIDSALIENVTEITGALIVNAPGMTTLSMPNLTRVGGSLQLLVPDLMTLDLSGLTSAGALVINAPMLTSLASLSGLTSTGDLVISNCASLQTLAGLDNLTSVGSIQIYTSGVTTIAALAGIATVGGDIHIEQNPALTTLAAFNLPTTVHAISIQANPELTTLSAFGEVTSADWIGVNYGGKLASFSLPKLATATAISVYSATGLQEVAFPLLETVTQDLLLRASPALTTFSAPILVSTGRFWMEDNALLASADVGTLTTITNTSTYAARVVNNPSYPTCLATAIENQLVGFTGTFTISGNSSASCP